MALQDLTPQLRTRLSRIERVVGVFVILATLILLAGLAYYVYSTAQRKGWFLTKAPYFVFVQSAAGLNVGDPVKLMGFDAGEITKIEPMPPSDPMFNVYVEFAIRSPYYGYLWTDSRAKLTAGDFLGNRFLEVTKGTNGVPTYQINSGEPTEPNAKELPITGVWNDQNAYIPINKKFEVYNEKDHTYKYSPYWLRSEESPSLSDRLDDVIAIVQANLPIVFSLTNSLAESLTNSAHMVERLDQTLLGVQPILTNLTIISAQLSNPHGALGEWLIPTQINQRIQGTLTTADATLRSANTNVNMLADNLNHTLESVAAITANLKDQVQANSLMLSQISSLVVDADDFVQGLKRNWLLKASFQSPSNPPIEGLVAPSVGGGGK
ncbi:MAG: MlaD family protein [Candidatus Omnitrophica bacterium]|nr:MlaD family protein [Candidatus Omnitrophota bacterium]